MHGLLKISSSSLPISMRSLLTTSLTAFTMFGIILAFLGNPAFAQKVDLANELKESQNTSLLLAKFNDQIEEVPQQSIRIQGDSSAYFEDTYLRSLNTDGEFLCTDGKDNDGDGKIDCEDSDCSGHLCCSGAAIDVEFEGIITSVPTDQNFNKFECYGGYYFDVKITKVILDGSYLINCNKLQIGQELTVCYGETRDDTLKKDDNVTVKGIYYWGTGPFQLIGDVVGQVIPSGCAIEIDLDDKTCFDPGEIISHTVRFRDSSGALADPDPTSSMKMLRYNPDNTTTDITTEFKKIATGVYQYNQYLVWDDSTFGTNKLEVKAKIGTCDMHEEISYEIQGDCEPPQCSIEIDTDGGKTCYEPGASINITIRFLNSMGDLEDPVYKEIGYCVLGMCLPYTSKFDRFLAGDYRLRGHISYDTGFGTRIFVVSAKFSDDCEAGAQHEYKVQRCCDDDCDNDGLPNDQDKCKYDPNKTEPGDCGCGIADNDSDADGKLDCEDNCPGTFNPDQNNGDGDRYGDACDIETRKIRVWFDINNNNRYDSGEGIPEAFVLVNDTDKGITNDQGAIYLENLNDNDRIYAYAFLYHANKRKANEFDTLFGSDNNPYDRISNRMYNFVMASDIMGTDGNYHDFPGQNKTLKNAKKDSQGHILVELVHPELQWNLVVAFQEKPSDDYMKKVKTGIQNASNYIYNYTDGYSWIRNVVLVKGAYEGTDQWDYCDVQIYKDISFTPNSPGCMVCTGADQVVKMTKYWTTSKDDPSKSNWYRTLGHELGHFIFGYYDEYRDGNWKDAWPYRQNNNGNPANEPNEFPENYGLMDRQYNTHEMSDVTDYYLRIKPSGGNYVAEQVTLQKFKYDESCWEQFVRYFNDQINSNLQREWSSYVDRDLIIPPNTSGSYNDGNNYEKRNGPSSGYHTVNIIEWTLPTAQVKTASTANQVFDAMLKVLDTDGNPIQSAKVWLASEKKNSFQGTTDKEGLIQCDSLGIGKGIEVYFSGLKESLTINELKDEYTVTFPFSLSSEKKEFRIASHNIQQTNVPGVIVSAKPDDVGSDLQITISGDTLDKAPVIILSQPTGVTKNVTMTSAGGNIYSGNVFYEYGSGYLDVTAISGSNSNQSLNPFIVYDLEAGETDMFYASKGGLEITYFSDSFSGSGKVAIVTSSAPAPENNNLVQVGNVFSFEFSNNVGYVKHLNLNIMLSSNEIEGLDASQLRLYGWNESNGTWNVIPGGGNNLDSFGITLDSVDYASYALFAPMSTDTVPPNSVTEFQASTGNSRWRINLEWSAPADDTAVYAYDIRYNTSPITESNWDDCIPIGSIPTPTEPGSKQSTIVEMPDPDTEYYFAIRAIDAAGNQSPLTGLATAVKSQVIDTDGDGMPDKWETSNSLNAAINDSQNDDDADGLINIQEYQHHSDPKDVDTDNDGYIDPYEVSKGTDPADPQSVPLMSVPTSQQSFTYPPTAPTVKRADPPEARPLGVGSCALGGDTLSLQAGLGQFSGNVDIYLAIYAPSVDPVNIYLITSDSIQPLSMGIAPWKANITGPIDERLFGDIPTSELPAGTYYFGIMITPTGNMSNNYFWITSFVNGFGAEDDNEPVVSNLTIPSSACVDDYFRIQYDYSDPDGLNNVKEHHIEMSDGWEGLYFTEGKGTGRFDVGEFYFETPGSHWVKVYVVNFEGHQSNVLQANISIINCD